MTNLREHATRALPSVIGFVVFVVSLKVVRHEIGALSWRSISSSAFSLPSGRVESAVALTALNYAVLTAYDFIAFRYAGRALARWRVAVTSFLAYAIANNVGFAMLSGASVRYRFYTRWGVTHDELSRIAFSYLVTFWLGLLTLGGLSLAIRAFPGASVARATAVGWSLVGVSVAYVAMTAVRREPLRVASFEFPLPSTRIAIGQLLASSIEWTLAAAVFYVLLPNSEVPFLTVAGAFLVAHLLGLVSHVPGGAGVFEGTILVLLRPFFTSGALLPSLVVYRAVYYFLPLCVAVAGLIADEVWQHRVLVARVGVYLDRISGWVTPPLAAMFAFAGGMVLLFSGATPAAAGRLAAVSRVLPLGVIETSHIVGSLAGAALLLLAQGLTRRLVAAYYLTATILGVGIAASLLKGADYEEALLLAVLLLVLSRARPAFYRKAALLETRFSPRWIAAVASALGASMWLGFFVFRHVEYSNDLWWQFALNAEAPRFLRASVGAATLVLLVAAARLIAPARGETAAPTDDELDAAAGVIAGQASTAPFLVYLRDKALLFDEARTAFVMYRVQRGTWVALGDPVGPIESAPALIRSFLERCDDVAATPVFYRVRKEYLHQYADFGLTFVKLGEEARVDLERFTLAGSDGAKFRQVVRRLEKDGGTFRVIPADDVPLVVGQLRTVSDDWLQAKSAAEKGFSLGFFSDAYIARFPVAVVEREERIVAFANLWPGSGKEELSIDLMRYDRGAPKNTMEALIVHVLLWGQQHGYRSFALGMAPMSGFERSPIAPLWARMGAFVFDREHAVYNFRGLRAFKEKFDPIWDPCYLAYPGGLRLPTILADVGALIAGGYRRIVLR